VSGGFRIRSRTCPGIDEHAEIYCLPGDVRTSGRLPRGVGRFVLVRMPRGAG
jgi:hypothetical protein